MTPGVGPGALLGSGRLGFSGGLVFREAWFSGRLGFPGSAGFGKPVHAGWWLGESRQMTAGAKQELLNNKP
jgi:hypothetical protein